MAPLSGAEFRIGREAESEFAESLAKNTADDKTMGMTCLIQARETNRPQKFIPPYWAYTYDSDDALPKREHDIRKTNFWWMEVGGKDDILHNAEKSRDELLKIAFGVWDHIKNRGDHGAENWTLDWIGFLPGKRESRRYIGDYILDQNDILNNRKFDDSVAYGGWWMDDHPPEGFYSPHGGAIFTPTPAPFEIPFRCLYSQNIENLFFAGRNISVTHTALSATRVMATCATLGQAVGTAAAIAINQNLSPRDVYKKRIELLQQTLMRDDCFLPHQKRQVTHLSKQSRLLAKGVGLENLRNGYDRPLGQEDNLWRGSVGDMLEFHFSSCVKVSELRFVFDSSLDRNHKNGDQNQSHASDMRCFYPLDQKPITVPKTLVKSFRIEGKDETGSWGGIYQEKNNYQRLVIIPVDCEIYGVRFIPEETWGSKEARVFSWDVYCPEEKTMYI